MATFALEQVQLQRSPMLIGNLEAHWNARERTL